MGRIQLSFEDKVATMIYEGLKRGKKSEIFQKAIVEYYKTHKEEIKKDFRDSMYIEIIDGYLRKGDGKI